MPAAILLVLPPTVATFAQLYFALGGEARGEGEDPARGSWVQRSASTLKPQSNLVTLCTELRSGLAIVFFADACAGFCHTRSPSLVANILVFVAGLVAHGIGVGFLGFDAKSSRGGARSPDAADPDVLAKAHQHPLLGADQPRSSVQQGADT